MGEAEIVQHPFGEAFVGGDVAPDPDHFDAVDHLFLIEPVFVARIDFPLGEIGGTGDNRDFHPFFNPLFAVLVSPGGRCVGFGREVIGEEEDFHCQIKLSSTLFFK